MRILIAVALAGASTAADAKQDYAAYEGRDAIQEGQGGTKVSKNGIDFWTNGTPPRRFKVLGILTDARKDRMLDGNVFGSKSVAKKALEAGGDAVVVLGASTRQAGSVNTANVFAQGYGASAYGVSRTINRTTTQLLVVKYLSE